MPPKHHDKKHSDKKQPDNKEKKHSGNNVQKVRILSDLTKMSGVLAEDGKSPSSDARKELAKYFVKYSASLMKFIEQDLIEIYGMVVVLKKCFGISAEWFHEKTVDDAKNELVNLLNKNTNIAQVPMRDLKALVSTTVKWHNNIRFK